LSLVFFTDRDLGNTFPDILASAGLTVERHFEHFPHDCPDERWLQYVGDNKRLAITHDQRIRYKPNELAAVLRHRVALLVVVGKAPSSLLARSFVATVPRILAFAAEHEAPFIAKVHRASAPVSALNPGAPGSVSLWYPR